MSSIYYLVPTLIAVVVSLLIVRIGAIALMLTGLSFDKAKFQALSAFTGTGFTTREAERVVNNSRRRKIVSLLMILGNVGIVTVIVTATSSFARVEGLQSGLHLLALLAGLGLIFLIVRNTSIAQRLEAFAEARMGRLKIFDDDITVDELLHLSEGCGVVRVGLMENSPFVGQTLSEINAGLDHSCILGVERDREWLPTPKLIRKLMAQDHLVIYGRLEDLAKHFG
ncbi:MAG: TrkA C-terminal domain-containing protein [Chromatiaceae bacterium]|nr:TrkA C-terminal domain-containing protein [Chromatiaceae bacterium]